MSTRLRSVEGQVVNFYEEMFGMFKLWCRGLSAQLKGKELAVEEGVGHGGGSSSIGDVESDSKFVVPATVSVKPTTVENTVEMETASAPYHKMPPSRGFGGKFSLPENRKFDIPVFKGDGDVLNWLYQKEHLFAIHETPIEEFCVFYLKEAALVWWRGLEKEQGGYVFWPEFYDECCYNMDLTN